MSNQKILISRDLLERLRQNTLYLERFGKLTLEQLEQVRQDAVEVAVLLDTPVPQPQKFPTPEGKNVRFVTPSGEDISDEIDPFGLLRKGLGLLTNPANRQEAKSKERVYFAQAGKRIKIGFSSDVQKRLQSLQTSSPDRIFLLGSIQGGLKEERAWHERFDGIRLTGEWFKATPELKQAIADALAALEVTDVSDN